jgi:hypothetical protein
MQWDVEGGGWGVRGGEKLKRFPVRISGKGAIVNKWLNLYIPLVCLCFNRSRGLKRVLFMV